MQDETFIPIHDMDEWQAFYSDNREALESVADYDTSLALARNQSLLIGGGASPLFRIGFVD